MFYMPLLPQTQASDLAKKWGVVRSPLEFGFLNSASFSLSLCFYLDAVSDNLSTSLKLMKDVNEHYEW
jgi:hypothetical protein